MLKATRKSFDPTSDWTATVTKFFITVLKEDPSLYPPPPSSSSRGAQQAQQTIPPATSQQLKQARLAYVIKLIRWNYSEGLLDRGIYFHCPQ